MPELPAVEFSRQLLEKHIIGQKISQVLISEDPIIFEDVPAEQVRRELIDTEIIGTGRHGKYLWLKLLEKCRGNIKYLLMHFGMTGFVQVRGVDRLCYKSAPETLLEATAPKAWPPRFQKLVMETEIGSSVAFGDARRLGRVKILHHDPYTVAPVRDLGFDPILSMPPYDEQFFKRATSRSVTLKALLLDQSFAAGVGNWMADDIMLHARIHPETRTDTLTPSQVEMLHKAVRYISERAVAVNADGSRFPSNWLFNYRWPSDRKTRTDFLIDGKYSIQFITVGGRTTAFVPELQKKTLKARPDADAEDDVEAKPAGPKRRRAVKK